MVPQNSSPLRNSTTGAPFRQYQPPPPQLVDSALSTRLVVNNNAMSGGPKVGHGHSPLRSRSHSKSKSPAAHQARGVRNNINYEQYQTVGQPSNDTARAPGHSPLRQSMPVSANGPTLTAEPMVDSMLRRSRLPGQPSEEELAGNQAATIMTSVRKLLLLTNYCTFCDRA